MKMPSLNILSPEQQKAEAQNKLLITGALAAYAAARKSGGLAPPAAPPPMQPGVPGQPPMPSGMPPLGGGPLGMAPPPPPPMAGLGAPPMAAPAPMPAPAAPGLFATGGMVPEEPMTDMPAPEMGADPMAAPMGAGEIPLPTLPGVIPAHALVEMAIKAMRGEEVNPDEYAGAADLMDAGAELEPPPQFEQWLSAQKPEDANELVAELIEAWQADPESLPRLWAAVLAEAAEEPEALPPALLYLVEKQGGASERDV